MMQQSRQSRKCRYLCWVIAALAIVVLDQTVPAREPPPYNGPSVAELDSTREWFWAHPPDGKNTAERRGRMAVIQAAADQFPSDLARRYIFGLASASIDRRAVEQCGVPYYLRRATEHTLDNIRHTTVTRGLAAWYIYNQDFVYRFPSPGPFEIVPLQCLGECVPRLFRVPET